MKKEGSKEIREGNKLIAEFMGWHKDSQGFWIGCSKCSHFKLTFDSSWDELMPVVIKIATTDFIPGNVLAQTNMYEKIISALMELDIKKVWQSASDFIEWYTSSPHQSKTSK